MHRFTIIYVKQPRDRRVLNNEVYLYDVLPASTSIFDQVSIGAEWPTTDSHVFNVAVQGDEGSRLFWETVPPLGFVPSDMYTQAFWNVSLDVCADYCFNQYSDW